MKFGFQAKNGQAKVRYLDADFQVIEDGSFVTCAVSGKPIKLADLTYWNVDRQEAYASPQDAFARYQETEARLLDQIEH